MRAVRAWSERVCFRASDSARFCASRDEAAAAAGFLLSAFLPPAPAFSLFRSLLLPSLLP